MVCYGQTNSNNRGHNHQLNQDIERRTGSILEWVVYGVTITVALCVKPLPPKLPFQYTLYPQAPPGCHKIARANQK